MTFDQVVATNVYLDDLSDFRCLTRCTPSILARCRRREPRSSKSRRRSAKPTRTITSRAWSKSRSSQCAIDMIVEISISWSFAARCGKGVRLCLTDSAEWNMFSRHESGVQFAFESNATSGNNLARICSCGSKK